MSLAKDYLLKIGAKPSKLRPYEWADYLELLCLANQDGELSQDDIIDRFSIRVSDLQEATQDEIEENKTLNSDEGEIASNRGKISDNWETKLRDWFAILKMRQKLYGAFYPFQVENREIVLKYQIPNAKQKLYIYLLLCSNLSFFSPQNSNKLSNSFEVLSLKAFKNVLPEHAKIHFFGKNPLNKKGPFKGNLSFWDKVNNFSKLINESLTHKMKEEDYPANNTGDGGLDIVGWIPTYDDLQSKIIFLGQCACGGDWEKKQQDSSHDTWSPKIEFTNSTLNNIFIPYCYRQSNGSWFKAAEIKKSFLLDRKRILEYSCKNGVLNYKLLPAYTIVDEIFKAKENII